MPDATSLYIYHPETQASSMTSPPLVVAMSEINSDQPYGLASVGSGHGLGHSSDFHDINFLGFYNGDHNMEGSPTSPPSFNQWDSASSMLPYQFPISLDEELLSWSHSHQLYNDSGFRSATYPDGFTQDPLTSPDKQLSESNYFNLTAPSGALNFPIISGEEPGQQHQVVGNSPKFPSLSPAFSHDAETLSPAGIIPGPRSRSEHELPQEPLSPHSGLFQARGYPMHSFESPLNTEDPDYKKNPETMRKTWMADYSRFVDNNKVFKIFSKHAKEKVATINTIQASVRRRTNPAKFKCSIRGCYADFTRKHNLENHLKSHCGVTDRICDRCGKGFTTIPVWKRHQKTCEKAASSSKTATPKRFLDAMTAQRPA